MRKQKKYSLPNHFKEKLQCWGSQFSVCTFLDSNNFSKTNTSPYGYHSFDFIAAIDKISTLETQDKDTFDSLKEFHETTNDWLFGFLSYDLKNETENLKSENTDEINFPAVHFFQAKYIFKIYDQEVEILFLSEITSESQIDQVFKEITNTELRSRQQNSNVNIQSRFTKEEYLQSINKLQELIHRGDIYEINFCQEFFSRNTKLHPLEIFKKLISLSPTPFSCYYKIHDKYLICASPERFLKKIGTKIISQPIKGTAKRGLTPDEDNQIIMQLICDEKERAENIMIVDLVRNDLSRTAEKGSVKLEELCGIYSFKQVHQLISTVSSEISHKYHFTDVIKFAFPMGSMTGAPKISAMQIIEKYERTKRGLYSGSVGYITPDGDFDFNVVIRSILYNSTNKYLSFSVGGAITSNSDLEKEYEECLLKAEAIRKVLGV